MCVHACTYMHAHTYVHAHKHTHTIIPEDPQQNLGKIHVGSLCYWFVQLFHGSAQTHRNIDSNTYTPHTHSPWCPVLLCLVECYWMSWRKTSVTWQGRPGNSITSYHIRVWPLSSHYSQYPPLHHNMLSGCHQEYLYWINSKSSQRSFSSSTYFITWWMAIGSGGSNNVCNRRGISVNFIWGTSNTYKWVSKNGSKNKMIKPVQSTCHNLCILSH